MLLNCVNKKGKSNVKKEEGYQVKFGKNIGSVIILFTKHIKVKKKKKTL